MYRIGRTLHYIHSHTLKEKHKNSNETWATSSEDHTQTHNHTQQTLPQQTEDTRIWLTRPKEPTARHYTTKRQTYTTPNERMDAINQSLIYYINIVKIINQYVHLLTQITFISCISLSFAQTSYYHRLCHIIKIIYICNAVTAAHK